MSEKSILIIGDIILDQYYQGNVQRISPEAPIPIVNMFESRETLGGAANVANNIAALGVKAVLVGLIGNDEDGDIVESTLKERNIIFDSRLVSQLRKTNKKMRIIGNGQQIARLDFNEDQVVSVSEQELLFNIFIEHLNSCRLVIISDYAKGVCGERLCRLVIEECNKKKICVIVDPKGRNWIKYKGATIITPNVKELSEYLGKVILNDDIVMETECDQMNMKLQIPNLLITRSEKGMTLIRGKLKPIHFLTKAQEVFDVSGAGDTVIAALAVFWDCRENLKQAIYYANLAAEIAVSKRGTATVSKEELEESCRQGMVGSIENKIVDKKQLMARIRQWKAQGRQIAFTNGCFDIFHKGHVLSIYAAAETADCLIVAINSDKSVKKIKGINRPINNQYDRAYVIAALSCVAAVIIFDEDTPEKILKMVKPDVLVKGQDYKLEEVIGKEYAKRVELIPYIKGYSSTGLIEKMKSSQIEERGKL